MSDQVVSVLGTHKDGTDVLLAELSSQYVQQVYLYNEPGETTKEIRDGAVLYEKQLNSIQTTTEFITTTEMGDISRSSLIIMWGFQFANLRSGIPAAKKFFRVLMQEILDANANPLPKIIFSSNQRGLIYATLLKQITIGVLDLDISIVSSMSMVGIKEFGNDPAAARLWPTSDWAFFIEDGLNSEKHEKLAFLRRDDELPILEATCVSEIIRIHTRGIPEAISRVSIIGRFPSKTEADEYKIDQHVAVFLPQDSEEDLRNDDVKEQIKSLSEFVKSKL